MSVRALVSVIRAVCGPSAFVASGQGPGLADSPGRDSHPHFGLLRRRGPATGTGFPCPSLPPHFPLSLGGRPWSWFLGRRALPSLSDRRRKRPTARLFFALSPRRRCALRQLSRLDTKTQSHFNHMISDKSRMYSSCSSWSSCAVVSSDARRLACPDVVSAPS